LLFDWLILLEIGLGTHLPAELIGSVLQVRRSPWRGQINLLFSHFLLTLHAQHAPNILLSPLTKRPFEAPHINTKCPVSYQ
jgi:hypothetical protein